MWSLSSYLEIRSTLSNEIIQCVLTHTHTHRVVCLLRLSKGDVQNADTRGQGCIQIYWGGHKILGIAPGIRGNTIQQSLPPWVTHTRSKTSVVYWTYLTAARLALIFRSFGSFLNFDQCLWVCTITGPQDAVYLLSITLNSTYCTESCTEGCWYCGEITLSFGSGQRLVVQP